MLAAAVAALTAGAFAAGCQEDPEPVDCVTTFTVKFSGKTATENAKQTYKTVQKLSGKGYLYLKGATAVDEEISGKIGSEKFAKVLENGEITKFTVFGKNLAKAIDVNQYKPGKSYSVESDLGVKFTAQGDEQLNVNQVAFGKATIKISKASEHKSACGEPTTTPGCVPTMLPVSYNGWFTGDFSPLCLDEKNYNDGCYEFGGSPIALIGGTWSAKYSKSKSIAAVLAD